VNGLQQERETAEALGAEFGMQVWTDLRPRTDGGRHWHARQAGWSPFQIISGHDPDDLRDRLIMHQRLTDAAASLLDTPAADGEAGADAVRSSG
jgi:hypothetical protein